MHAGIFVMPDGRFKISTTAKCPRTGQLKKVRKTLQEGVALHEAVMIRDQIKAEIQDEPDEAPQRLLLCGYAEAWITRRAARLKPSTEHTYRNILSYHIIPVLGDLYADVVRRSDVEDWITWAEQQRQESGAPYAQETLSKWWRCLVTMLRDMAADLHIDDPTRRLKPPRSAREAVRETRTLSRDELGALLEAIAEQAAHRYAEVLTMAYTGMRSGEVYALGWDAIDYERESIVVCQAVSAGQVTDTKTHAAREVYMPPVLAAALQAHRRELIRVQHRGLSSGLVFPSDQGTPRTPGSVRKVLEQAAEDAGISQRVSPQVLRRTFNTLLVAAGTDHVVLQSQMGHSSEAMTRRYAGVRLESKREAVVRGLFEGGVQ